MRRIIAIVIAFLAAVFAGYIWLMACFEGPIVRDATDEIAYIHETHDIELPWYHRIYTEAYGKCEGTDALGNAYTAFYYDLPDIFEYAEMNCIVSWSDETARMYIGESRAMEAVDRDYPEINWAQRYTAL